MTRSIRFAVVGLGHFAQAAILPAIHRQRGATITALVSGTPQKLEELGQRYSVPHLCDYSQYDDLLASGELDAVYIALPNDLHADAAVRAASAGLHVMVEKPMAPTEAECRRMIEACRREDVRLMIAYRLHFQSANLHVIDLIGKGAIGEPRMFSSVNSFQIRDENIRIEARPGAGPLYDIGVYCINAARYVFKAEPIACYAHRIENAADDRFRAVEEGMAATLRFKGGRVASFQCSYGAAHRSYYEVIGTEGVITVENAFEYAEPMVVTLVKDGKHKRRSFRKADQIAAEVQYFVRCIRNEIEPEPSGVEGLADVHIIQAVHEAARSGQQVSISPIQQDAYPTPEQEITRPPHGMPPLVGVESASRH
jgi:glucose-fructose oxidoreductase